MLRLKLRNPASTCAWRMCNFEATRDAAKVEFVPGLTVEQLALAIDAVEALIRAAVPEVHLIFLEPDIHRGGGLNPPTAGPAEDAQPHSIGE